KQVTGINSEFYHIGSRYSSTAFHCEDTNLQSCNVTDYGWKVWLIVKTHHTAKFEEFVGDTWGGCKCQQFIRHLNLLIAPSRLRKEGIEFDIRCTGRGEMIITEAYQYHYTMNYSESVARSINF
ncbi:JmjC domain-containing protein, partial [Dactylonectria estremocensis]